MIWIVLLGIVGAIFLTMTLDRAFNWQVALPRNPTFGQQMRAMAVEFFGKLTLLFGLLFAGFILLKILAG